MAYRKGGYPRPTDAEFMEANRKWEAEWEIKHGRRWRLGGEGRGLIPAKPEAVDIPTPGRIHSQQVILDLEVQINGRRLSE